MEKDWGNGSAITYPELPSQGEWSRILSPILSTRAHLLYEWQVGFEHCASFLFLSSLPIQTADHTTTKNQIPFSKPAFPSTVTFFKSSLDLNDQSGENSRLTVVALLSFWNEKLKSFSVLSPAHLLWKRSIWVKPFLSLWWFPVCLSPRSPLSSRGAWNFCARLAFLTKCLLPSFAVLPGCHQDTLPCNPKSLVY